MRERERERAKEREREAGRQAEAYQPRHLNPSPGRKLHTVNPKPEKSLKASTLQG